MSLALATDQLSVADCPRWIEDGSAVKLSMRGGCGLVGGGGGGSTLAAGGGGGGGATGALFLHPSTATSIVAANTAALSVPLFSLIFTSCLLSSVEISCWRNSSLSPSTTPVEGCSPAW